jgi:hypothetical protein
VGLACPKKSLTGRVRGDRQKSIHPVAELDPERVTAYALELESSTNNDQKRGQTPEYDHPGLLTLSKFRFGGDLTRLTAAHHRIREQALGDASGLTLRRRVSVTAMAAGSIPAGGSNQPRP